MATLHPELGFYYDGKKSTKTKLDDLVNGGFKASQCIRFLDGTNSIPVTHKRTIVISETWGELGLRAGQNLQRNDLIAIFAGVVVPKPEVRRLMKLRMGSFLLQYKFDGDCVNAKNIGNETRFVNHKCKNPNASFYQCELNSQPLVGLFALQRIPRGTSITVQYSEPDAPPEERYKYLSKCYCTSKEHFLGGQPQKRHQGKFLRNDGSSKWGRLRKYLRNEAGNRFRKAQPEN